MQNNFEEKRVLFCLHYSDLNNGAVRSLIDVVEVLINEYNVKAYVIYPDHRGSAIDYLEKLGAICFYIPFYRMDYYETSMKVEQKIRNNVTYHLKKFVSPYFFYKAKKIISEYNITEIYSNTIVIDYGIQLSLRTGCSHVWHIREFGKEDHGLSLRKGENELYKNMEKSQAIIYISKAIENKYHSHIKDKTSQYVIYNDISRDFINPKRSFNMNKLKPLNATIIGTIQEGKGQLEAIRAVEKVNNRIQKVILHIAGKKEGKYYEKIVAYVDEHGLNESVVFDGFITAVNEYRSNMDIGIVASSNEAFGRVTIEGMLSELAIIGADAAGTLELVQDKKNGMLYHKGNVEQLAEILNLLYEDRNYMKQIAENGYKNAIDNYTTHRAAKKIACILQEI